MRPLTRALLLVILCYVFVLNSIVVNMLYKRFGYLVHLKAITMPKTQTAHANGTTDVPILHAPEPEPVCQRQMQLVIIVTQSRNTLSNDISKQVSLLTRLRTMLQDKHYNHIHMFLAVDVQTFMPVHRSLCSNIPRCSLLLTMHNEIAEVFDHIAKARPCINDIVLLTDKANVDSTFLLRVGHTDGSQVTCLMEAKPGEPCPDIAYRIPRFFFTSHRARSVDILSTATIEGVAAPPYAVLTPL